MKTQPSAVATKRCQSSPAPKRRRIVVLFSLSLFVFQLSLSLLLHPINQILCLEELRGSSSATEHDHHHDGALSHSHSEPEGDTLQHCKDTLFGIAVTPMQPFSLPVATSLHTMTAVWAISSQDLNPLIERSLPPPFQPPRA